MAETYRRRRRSGRWLWFILLLILLAGLWLGYWYAADWVAGKVLARAEAGGFRGVDLDCPDRQMGGFPFSIDVDCARTAVTVTGAGAAEAGAVAASAPLYLPGHVNSRLEGPLRVSFPALGLGLEMNWRAAFARASVMPSGLRRATADFDDVALTIEAGHRRLPIKALAAAEGQAEIGASRGASGSLDLAGSGRALVVVKADGEQMPVFDGSARLTLVGFGTTVGRDFGEDLRAWLARGGQMRLEQFRFAVDDFAMTLQGPMTLSPEGLISGELTVRIAGMQRLPDVAEAFRPGSRDEAALAVQAMAILSQPVNTDDGPAQETTLRIQNGEISFGIIPTGVSIPPLMP